MPIVIQVILGIFGNAEVAISPIPMLWDDSTILVMRFACSFALAAGASLLSGEGGLLKLEDLRLCGISSRSLADQYIAGKLISYAPAALVFTTAAYLTFAWWLRYESDFRKWPGIASTFELFLAGILPQCLCLLAGVAIEARFRRGFDRHFVAVAFYALYLSIAVLVLRTAETVIPFDYFDMSKFTWAVVMVLYPFNQFLYSIQVSAIGGDFTVLLSHTQYFQALALQVCYALVFFIAAREWTERSLNPTRE